MRFFGKAEASPTDGDSDPVQIQSRIVRYRSIEEHRQRPLIVYATSSRHGVGAILGGDAVREFIDQIDAVRGSSAVDVLIHSTGGDGLAAWKIMSELRERFETVSVLVPFMAFSAATLFALGADEIVMHPHASLGPIDPQITIQLPDGSRRAFAFEDVGAFLRFLAKEVNLTEQAPVATIADKLFSVVDPVHIGAAKRASELAADVGERLLKMHMTSDGDQARARAIAESLNKNFFAHGDAVSRTRARKLDLKIAPNNTELERLMWEAYTGIELHVTAHAFHPRTALPEKRGRRCPCHQGAPEAATECPQAGHRGGLEQSAPDRPPGDGRAGGGGGVLPRPRHLGKPQTGLGGQADRDPYGCASCGRRGSAVRSRHEKRLATCSNPVTVTPGPCRSALPRSICSPWESSAPRTRSSQ